MSDDTEPPPEGSGRLINFPAGDDVTSRPPALPDPSRLFPAPRAEDIPPESLEETTLELPKIPSAPNPESVLRSEGITETNSEGEEEVEYSEVDIGQRRSLADRLGDWLEFRLERARALHESEAAFREAEIARKAELLKGRTAAEVAMMEQNAKLRQAMLKAQADKAGARGKADAARSSSSGLGGDKGGRSKTGGGGGSRGGGGSSGGSGKGGGRGPGANGPGGTGRGSGGANSPKGASKGPDRSSGGRGGPTKGNESSGGSRNRQNGSGGSGKSGSGRGGSSGSGGRNGPGGSGSGRGGSKGDGSGKGGSKGDRSGRGGSKGEGGRRQDAPASPRAERARARRERAAARQAARDQRRSTDQAARIADRTKDRDQERAAGQAAREERRRAKAERKAARRAKREAAKTGGGRTTLGAAVAQEAQRRWDERRAAEKDKVEKDSTSGEDSGTTDKKEPQGGSGPAADGSKDAPKTGQADQAEPGGQQTADEPGKQGPGQGPGSSGEAGSDSSKGGWGWWKKKPEPPEGDEPGSAPGGQARPGDGDPYRDVFGQEDPQYTTDRPDRPDTNPGSGHRSDAAAPRADDDEDVVDAVIVEDPGDPFGADRVRRPGLTTGAPGLPPAPEKHTQRPGTSRSADTSTEGDSVSSGHVSKPSGGSGSLAAQHRTDITFGGFLMEMAATALKASSDQERAEALAEALGKVADALREMAADLVGDHNITTEVTDLIADLADSAGRMKEQARRCAEQCGLAREAVALVATQVARVYGQDMAAKRDAGLKHTSAAAHHD